MAGRSANRILASITALILMLAFLCSCASGPTPTPTAAPTTAPTAAPEAPVPSEPAATAAPLPTEAQPLAKYTPSAGFALPDKTENLQYGNRFHLFGSVETAEPMRAVILTIEGEGVALTTEVTFPEGAEITRYRTGDGETASEGASLHELAPFDKLPAGSYSLRIEAELVSSERVTAAESEFAVERGEWKRLTSNSFAGSYPMALEFFGDRELFMFTYKDGEGRDITTHPDWEKGHIITIHGVNGKRWPVHRSAVEHFERAVWYMENTYLRVYGTNGDSGVIRLDQLAVDFNGSYNSRFVSDSRFISHHALGTAIDINANISPNENTAANKAVIAREVGQNLAYDGIAQDEDGLQYYCFSYSGDWAGEYDGVPACVMNYLLYELAFYRAGFSWGHYYRQTSDGMHFALTEIGTEAHEGENGLKKIELYI